MELYKFLYQSESDAGPLLSPAARSFDTVEAFEQVWQFVLGNAGTRVSN
jgi:hypothetical protein